MPNTITRKRGRPVGTIKATPRKLRLAAEQLEGFVKAGDFRVVKIRESDRDQLIDALKLIQRLERNLTKAQQ